LLYIFIYVYIYIYIFNIIKIVKNMYNFLIIINKIGNKIKSKFEIYQKLKLVPFYYCSYKILIYD